ncbi:hypothetical protein GQ43DRAFT_432355 [Delitschia confertaspora ATCC 74209]|uniref:Uncharacterized protein n=1 Tax=Delitschia confertaspora ATCC 74209 TaxID=1513339 RepID=A0A9P4JNY4_9PLEO|nr:hypothetical protein GQ43DRAFT_432355 [Delitschia confertaspora ATCC 74209]
MSPEELIQTGVLALVLRTTISVCDTVIPTTEMVSQFQHSFDDYCAAHLPAVIGWMLVYRSRKRQATITKTLAAAFWTAWFAAVGSASWLMEWRDIRTESENSTYPVGPADIRDGCECLSTISLWDKDTIVKVPQHSRNRTNPETLRLMNLDPLQAYRWTTLQTDAADGQHRARKSS